MTPQKHHDTGKEKIRKAAENAFLIFVSRWATVLMVPLILGTGGWIVTSVQTLMVEVQTIRTELRAQGDLFESKLRAVDTSVGYRLQNAERRLDRLETQSDRARGLIPQQNSPQ